jgi:hypothetical protein
MPISIQRLQAAQQQGPTTTGQVLAETVQALHLFSHLSQDQQAQFRTCCACLAASATEASCPALLLAADVCFNYAYQLRDPAARGCPRHPLHA